MIYYVYAYIRKSDGTPYYIGKGKKLRAYAKHAGVSVPTDKTKIVFLETCLTEIGALALERRYIRWWGRKDLWTGCLLNQTDGGEGHSNPSADARSKIGAAHKGKIITDEIKAKQRAKMQGRSPSAEHRVKLSNALRGKSTGPMSAEQKEVRRLASLLAWAKKKAK